MAIRFDRDYVDIAREEFHKVYVDDETATEFIGSETGYVGDRIRIYVTDWEYETPETFRTNEEFMKWMNDFIFGFYGLEPKGEFEYV